MTSQEEDRLLGSMEEGQDFPLLGAPAVTDAIRFDDIATESLARPADPQRSYFAEEETNLNPNEYPQATRFMSIPELPSASAKWNSIHMHRMFSLLLMTSIVQMLLSIPYVMVIIGVIPMVTSVLAMVAASNFLCECCQSMILEANVSMVFTMMVVAASMDAVFLALTIVPTIGAFFDSFEYEGSGLPFLIFLMLATFIGHNALCVYIAMAARRLKGLMRSVRPGMVVAV